MPEWNTRLAIQYKVGSETVRITPIDSFSPSFAMNIEPLHSIEQSHIGAIFSPPSITFTISVKAIGGVVGRLTKLALEGTLFDIVVLEQEGNDWSFESFVLSQCMITSATPTTATISGAPAATFSGLSLSAALDPKDTTEVKLP